MKSSNLEVVLSLIRIGVGHSTCFLHDNVNWEVVKDIAYQHGVSAIVLDGVERISEYKRPSKDLLLQWIGEVMQSYDNRYKQYLEAISSLAEYYRTNGFRMMLIKGYACSIDWPKPEHRSCGDIDIWQFGRQKESDDILVKEKGIKIDNSEHHHSRFNWHGFVVENHYDFINVYHHKSNKEIEKTFKLLGKNDSYYTEILGENVYLPSPNLHALFLLRHASSHFAAEGITLRHILDWGFFVKAHRDEINWNWLEKEIERYGMTEFYNISNAICVDDFCFDSSIFPCVQYNPQIKEDVLDDILTPKYGFYLPDGFFKRIIYKIRRWHSSEWKHKMCYKESMWSSFGYGLWSHLKRPLTI